MFTDGDRRRRVLPPLTVSMVWGEGFNVHDVVDGVDDAAGHRARFPILRKSLRLWLLELLSGLQLRRLLRLRRRAIL